MRISFLQLALLLTAGFSVFSSASQAATIDLSATERGSYKESSTNFATALAGTAIGNYLTGYSGAFGGAINGTEYRSFFNFDLSSVADTILSADLELSLGDSTLPSTMETLEIFEYAGSIPDLIGGAGSTLMFADLASGTLYGSGNAATGASAGSITISINAAGIAALNSAIGGDFAVGGALQSLSGDEVNEYFFGGAAGAGRQTTLHLMVGAVPEPSTALLLGFGLVGLGAQRPRKRPLV